MATVVEGVTGLGNISGYGASKGNRNGGVLSDGSYFLIAQSDRKVYWSDDQGATWTAKLTLTCSYAWETGPQVWVDSVNDVIYVVATADGGATEYAYYWKLTYDDSTEAFTEAAGPVAIGSDATSIAGAYIAKFPDVARLLASYYDGGSDEQWAQYSTNDGAAWTQFTGYLDTAARAGRAFARDNGTVVLLNHAGNTAFQLWVFADDATACPTNINAVSGSPSGNTNGYAMCQDPDTGDIYGYVWDYDNQVFRARRFNADDDTWTTLDNITPQTAHKPAASAIVHMAAIHAGGHRQLVYCVDGATAVYCITDEAGASSAALFTADAAVKEIAILDDSGPWLYIVAYSSAANIYATSVSLNTGPDAPTGLKRPDFDAGYAARFRWNFVDDDIATGDAQTAFALRIRETGTETWYYAQSDGTLAEGENWLTTANEFFDLDASELTNGKAYDWQVSTKDQAGVASSYSDTANFDCLAALRYFVEEPSWQGQIGPQPNRVYVRILGGTDYELAETVALADDDAVEHWVEVPSGTSSAEAQATADQVLAVLQDRSIAIQGTIPLSVRAPFDGEFIVQWWELDTDGNPTKKAEHQLLLAKKEHDIDAGTTTLSLGDYAPPVEEVLARILAKLARKS